MLKLKPFCMEQQPVRRRERWTCCIEVIPQDRMTQMLHVDPKLMGSAGYRCELYAGKSVAA